MFGLKTIFLILTTISNMPVKITTKRSGSLGEGCKTEVTKPVEMFDPSTLNDRWTFCRCFMVIACGQWALTKHRIRWQLSSINSWAWT